jgi:3-hydroxyisobutyrate dehydrogenase
VDKSNTRGEGRRFLPRPEVRGLRAANVMTAASLPVAGFTGLGNMGGAIARRILGAGYRLYVHDIRPEAVQPLEALGATPARDPETLAAACDVILLSLPSDIEVEEVVFGLHGVLRTIRRGAVLVNLTTGSVRQLPRLEQAGRTYRFHYVTAPVSQGVDNAATGMLTAFAAGTEQGLALARPVLETFCATIIRLDDHLAAMAAKLVTNLAWYVNAAALGEQMALLVRAGVPLEAVQQVMTASCGDSWVARHDIQSVLKGDYDPSFSLGLAAKDLRLIRELAEMTGVPLEVGAIAEAVFGRALDEYGPDAPELSPVRLLADRLGVALSLDRPAVPEIAHA